MTASFKEIIELCVNNKIDFEVWHGLTTHKEKSVRRQIQVSFPDAPGLFATFGDERHGEKLGRIIVSGNKNLRINASEFVEILSNPTKVFRDWKTTELGNEIMSENNLTVLDANKRIVLVSGRVEEYVGKTDEGWVHKFILETPYVMAGSNESYLSETTLTVVTQSPMGKGEKVVGSGVYSYPNRVTLIEPVTS